MKIIQLLSHAGNLYVLTDEGKIFVRTVERVKKDNSCYTESYFKWWEVDLPEECRLFSLKELAEQNVDTRTESN
jgi:hypothetical protein